MEKQTAFNSYDIIKELYDNEELKYTLEVINNLTEEEIKIMNSLYYHSDIAEINKLKHKLEKVYYKNYYIDGMSYAEFLDNIFTIYLTNKNEKYNFYEYIDKLIRKAVKKVWNIIYTDKEYIYYYLYYLIYVKTYYGYSSEYLLKSSLQQIYGVQILTDEYFNLDENELDNSYKIDIAFSYKGKIYGIQMKSYSFLEFSNSSYPKRNTINGVNRATKELGIDEVFICCHYHLCPLRYVCNAKEICSDKYEYRLSDRCNDYEELAEDIIYCIVNKDYSNPPIKERK